MPGSLEGASPSSLEACLGRLRKIGSSSLPEVVLRFVAIPKQPVRVGTVVAASS